MSTNGTVNGAAVKKAVEDQFSNLPEDLRSVLGLTVSEQDVNQENGDWIVRVGCDASRALEKSYELHRVLSGIQAAVEKQLGVFASILLKH